jgi:hypothetical protein
MRKSNMKAACPMPLSARTTIGIMIPITLAPQQFESILVDLCTRTEGRAPVWGSEFTAKAATQPGDSAKFVISPFVVGLCPVVARARVLVHGIVRAEKLAERRLRAAASITSSSKSKSIARGTYLPPEASW